MDDRSQDKIEIIQAMRGVAALLVVMWHASRYFDPYGTGWAGPVFRPGANLGVDLFFLISGFIMVVTTRSCDGSGAYAIRFMIKRFARVWPPYFVATLLFIALIPWRLASHVTPDGLWLLLQGVFFIPVTGIGAPGGFAFPPLPIGWTLNYEMYFYAFFAVSLAFGRARWVAFTAWILITLIALPHLLAPGGKLSILPSTSYGLHGYVGLITNPIILLFAAGCLIGVVHQSPLKFRNTFFLKLAMLVVASTVVLQYCSDFHTEHGISQWGLTLVPLLLIFSLASKTVTMALPRSVTYLGTISFSLYLFHPLAQEGFDYLVVYGGHGRPSGFLPFFVTTAACAALAALSYRYLELGLAGIVRDILMRAIRMTRPAPAAGKLVARATDARVGDAAGLP
jgi:exopolysaccharide production protein ExoZ